ncbi:transglutaminase family protein [Marinobacterium sp. LSUCC0821]|nr:transglutaminase family protein [Marinobacterium sp. LSUCC0821]
MTPEPSWRTVNTDIYGNSFLYFILSEPHQNLKIEIKSTLEVIDDTTHFTPKRDLSVGEALSEIQQLRISSPEIEEFLNSSPFVNKSKALFKLGAPYFTDTSRSLVSSIFAFTQHIFEEFEYSPGFSNVTTPITEVLEHKRGVCQDFAHISIGVLRSIGLPARYISGYLETLPLPGQEKLIGSDASHAWYEVFIPGEGWFGFDPTNNKVAGHQHIITARGRDYSDVSPLQGIFFGDTGEQSMRVEVDVLPER